jgi:hypothetical protein
MREREGTYRGVYACSQGSLALLLAVVIVVLWAAHSLPFWRNSIVPIAPLSWSRSAALSTLTKRFSIGILLLVPKRKILLGIEKGLIEVCTLARRARWRYSRQGL